MRLQGLTKLLFRKLPNWSDWPDTQQIERLTILADCLEVLVAKRSGEWCNVLTNPYVTSTGRMGTPIIMVPFHWADRTSVPCAVKIPNSHLVGLKANGPRDTCSDAVSRRHQVFYCVELARTFSELLIPCGLWVLTTTWGMRMHQAKADELGQFHWKPAEVGQSDDWNLGESLEM